MEEPTPGVVTRLLDAAEAGEPSAAAELLPIVYTELRRLARVLMAKVPPGNTLQTTALVHEAYVRLVERRDDGWNGRRHFFGAAARAMRQILVDQARRKAARKHGGGLRRVDAAEADLALEAPVHDVLALHEALEDLERRDPRAANVVSLRYFAGLGTGEIAEVLGVSASTVEREWRFARALLYTRLRDPGAGF